MIIKISNHMCEECNQYYKKLFLHHKDYKTLGNENWDDFKVLCQKHHDDWHFENPSHNMFTENGSNDDPYKSLLKLL